MASPSPLLVWSFVAVAAGTFVAFIALYSRAVGRFAVGPAIVIALWLAATFALAASGVLRFTPFPPTMVFLIVGTLVATILLARSRFGRIYGEQLPLAAIIGLNAFRLPLELVMHRAATEGVMPPQMSYSGWNYDIVSGATAIVVALVLASETMRTEMKRRIAAVWNILGFILLLTILTVATLSAPLPFRQFHNDPPNVWITHAPFVWLVTLLVPAAMFSHILLFRKLREAT